MSAKKVPKSAGVKIGFFSRIDYGSKGFRSGLLQCAAKVFVEEGVHFVVLAGGLVNERVLKEELRARLKGCKAEDGVSAADKRADIERHFYNECVNYLVEHIPHIQSPDPTKKWCKIYIVTSPAYDGEMGNVIAYRLARHRRDIIHWGEGEATLPTKQAGRDVCVLTASKTAWLRGDYYSTPVERVIKDHLKKTKRLSASLTVVGCFGSDIQKPKGESKVAYCALPVLHEFYETRTGSENQIGVIVVEYAQGSDVPTERTYSFNDVVANERQFIGAPKDVTKRQLAVVEALKRRGSLTVGLLAHELGFKNRSKLQEDIDKLNLVKASGDWPGLVLDGGSHKYDFNPEWIREHLVYKQDKGDFREDSLVAFACLHAGCITTDYDFFVNEVPKVMLARGSKILVGAGDFIEGLKHDLILKEVYGGLDYTRQEKFSASLVAEVLLRVFKGNLLPLIASRVRVSDEILRGWVNDSLPTFIYISGNHCQWTVSYGFHALETFGCELRETVIKGVRKVLDDCKVQLSGVAGLVRSKIIETSSYKLPNSGLKIEIFHPHMSRTKTTSIRPQEMMGFAKDSTAVVVGGNFHVAESVGEWSRLTGQRKCLQVGTIKWTSGFEANKLKIVDKGVGYLRVKTLNGRIVMTEVAFYGSDPPSKPLSNEDILTDLKHRFNITS